MCAVVTECVGFVHDYLVWVEGPYAVALTAR
jgi:hypothetical protein